AGGAQVSRQHTPAVLLQRFRQPAPGGRSRAFQVKQKSQRTLFARGAPAYAGRQGDAWFGSQGHAQRLSVPAACPYLQVTFRGEASQGFLEEGLSYLGGFGTPGCCIPGPRARSQQA